MTESKIEKDLVCGIHFHFGNAASLRDKYNPDWLPSLQVKTFRTTYETTRKSPENNRRHERKREHEEQDQAVKEKMSREDESGVHRDHR